MFSIQNKLFLTLLTISFLFPITIQSAIIAQNAGILPYSKKGSQIYVLLGLENRFQDAHRPWAKKAGTTKVWADFGGKCDIEDTRDAVKYKTNQATLCAAREAAEETRYVFGNKLPLKRGLNKSSPEFDKSVRYFISHATKHFKINGFYDQFFAMVDYVDATLITNSPKVPSYEKEDYLWVKVEDLIQSLQNTDRNGFSRINGTIIFPTLAKSLRRQDILNFLKSLVVIPTPQNEITVGIMPSYENRRSSGELYYLFLLFFNQQTGEYSPLETKAVKPIDWDKIITNIYPTELGNYGDRADSAITEKYLLNLLQIEFQPRDVIEQKGIGPVAWIDEAALESLYETRQNTIDTIEGESIKVSSEFANAMRIHLDTWYQKEREKISPLLIQLNNQLTELRKQIQLL